MANDGQATIERIDHGVVPSNDLGRAHRFYATFMGGELDHLTNLNLRGLNREVPQILFYTLANHKGWGLALQEFPISPNPARPLEGVVYGFEVAADNLADVARAAEERKLKFHGPVRYPAPCPIQESLFVLDPDGNTMELFGTRKSLVPGHLRLGGGKTSSRGRSAHAHGAELWAARDSPQGRSSRGAQYASDQGAAYRFPHRAGVVPADPRTFQAERILLGARPDKDSMARARRPYRVRV